MKNMTFEKMAGFCKKYGFIYPENEIYVRLANTWNYGSLGARLKNNFKDACRKRFIQQSPNSYEIDVAILMHSNGEVNGRFSLL